MREPQERFENRPIVVGTDGSSQANHAVEWAAAEAARRGRGLHIVSSARPWKPGSPFGPGPGHADALAEAGQAILTEAVNLAAKAAPEVTVTTEFAVEAPAVALCDQGHRAFEIVIGHRSRGDFSSLLLGSTGLRLADHAPCPVVVVRGESADCRNEILVGVDLRDHPTAVLEYTFETADLRGSWVRAVHAWDVQSALVTNAGPKAVRAMLTAVETQLAKAVAPWRARFPDTRVIEEVSPGHAIEELIERSSSADLLVVGSHRRGCGPRPGSVTHRVIHHADCPIAVIPS